MRPAGLSAKQARYVRIRLVPRPHGLKRAVYCTVPHASAQRIPAKAPHQRKRVEAGCADAVGLVQAVGTAIVVEGAVHARGWLAQDEHQARRWLSGTVHHRQGHGSIRHAPAHAQRPGVLPSP